MSRYTEEEFGPIPYVDSNGSCWTEDEVEIMGGVEEMKKELTGELLDIRFPEQDEWDDINHKWAKVEIKRMKESYENGNYKEAILFAEAFIRNIKGLEKSKGNK